MPSDCLYYTFGQVGDKNGMFGSLTYSTCNINFQSNNVRTHINPLIDNGLLQMVMSKTSSKHQKYFTAMLGKEFLVFTKT